MTKRELLKKLDNLCLIMSEDYNINNGGCCYVAAVIAEQLEIHNIDFVVAYTESPTHFAIRTPSRYINRDGFKFKEFHKWDSIDLYYTYDTGDWNDLYDRKWNLIVRSKILSLFKKYENSRT